MGNIKRYFDTVISFKAIVTVSIIAIICSVVYYLNYSSSTGTLWGVEQATMFIIIYAVAAFTVVILYFYNVRKSGWLLAVLNIIIQITLAILASPFLILYAVIRILGGRGASNSKQKSTPKTTVTKAAILRPYWEDANKSKSWVYKDGILRPYWEDANKKNTWVVNENIPIPVVVKAVGII